MEITHTSRQPHREPWTLECLNYECSILLGMSIDTSTAGTYSSALNSYLTFFKLHGLPVNPTPQTLSYYVTFQSFFINLKSVDSYLSGVTNLLEPFFPDVRKKPLFAAGHSHSRRCQVILWDSHHSQITSMQDIVGAVGRGNASKCEQWKWSWDKLQTCV